MFEMQIYSDDANATEYDADDPSPAPIGISPIAFMITLNPLLISKSFKLLLSFNNYDRI
mgnify:FL=1